MYRSSYIYEYVQVYVFWQNTVDFFTVVFTGFYNFCLIISKWAYDRN